MADPAPDPAAARFGFGTPWAEQIAHLQRKLALPSEWWDDITGAANDRAFIVAGAGTADLVQDLKDATEKATASGGIAEFRKQFKAIVAAKGWTGWTGEGTAKGEAWRTRIIYQTNMATSYAAGRWRQLNEPGFAALRPYWRYVHADGQLYPRPEHLRWNGLTLPREHPFWQQHYPPNGWGCRCEVRAVAAPAPGAATTPPPGWDQPLGATGEPPGIDKGFGYAPGANVDTPLRQMVQDKLINYDPAIARALSAELNRTVYAQADAAGWVTSVLRDKSISDPLFLGFVEDAAAVSVPAATDVQGYLLTLPGSTPRHQVNSHGHDAGGQRPARPEDYAQIAAVLNQADSLRPGEMNRGHATVVATKAIGGETFRAVFEVLTGKRNRALALLSLVIKTG